MKKYLVLLIAGSLLVACGPQEAEPVAVEVETETADEFVARVNAELVDLNREGGAAA